MFSNNYFVVNNFVMKCIENIFYLIFSTESNQKKTCVFFRASVPLILASDIECLMADYNILHLLYFKTMS